jgi:hypothetical protein
MTSLEVNRRVQNADICAYKKGEKYIDGLAAGKKCEELLVEAQTIVSLTNAIRGYIPEGETISGTQAEYYWNTSLCTLNNTLVLTIYDTDALANVLAVYTFVSPTTDNQEFTGYMTQVINDLNAYNPCTYPYTAVASTDNGGTTYIHGLDYDENNLQYVVATFTGGQFFGASSNYFLNGAVTETQPENCLTEEEVTKILNKLCTMCDCI